MQFSWFAKKVLVADDEKDTCLYLKRYLERKNLKVTPAFDGIEAKKFIEEGYFDFFVFDCSMPKLTGLELIELARQRNPRAKIALLSAFPSVTEAVVKRLGGDVFIQKPIQLSDLDIIFKEG